MKLTYGAVMLFGLIPALFQDLPVQGQTQASSIFEVVPTPNENPNSSANDIWAFGSYFAADGTGHQMTLLLHWDGTSWKVAYSPNPTKGGVPCDLLWTGVASSPENVWILGSVHEGSLAIHMTTETDSSLVSNF